MTAKLKGGVALDQLLASLPAHMERNILRGALKAGAEEYAEGARENCRSDEVRDTIKVSSRSEPGIVSAKVQTKGPGAFKAPWLEHGTDPHFISVDDELSGGRTVSRINRLAKEPDSSHSLVIGGEFAGSTVFHPGAKSHPFMRPAVDTREAEAIAAISNHIATKLTKEGLNSPPLPEEPDE
jgi:hypothetical protein